MKAKFKSVQKSNPNHPDQPYLYYAQIVPKDTYDLSKMAKRLADMSSLSVMDVQAVLLGFTELFPEILRQGNRIKLDGLGIFSLAAHSSGEEKEEQVSVRTIRKVRLRFAPNTKLKEDLQRTKFEKLQ